MTDPATYHEVSDLLKGMFNKSEFSEVRTSPVRLMPTASPQRYNNPKNDLERQNKKNQAQEEFIQKLKH